MKYMLLIHNRPGFVEELTEAEREALFGEVDAIMKELTESGSWSAGTRSPTRPGRRRSGRGRTGGT